MCILIHWPPNPVPDWSRGRGSQAYPVIGRYSTLIGGAEAGGDRLIEVNRRGARPAKSGFAG